MPRSELAASNASRLQAIYAAYANGDQDAVVNAVSRDAVWLSVGPSSLPWAGEYRGPDGVRAYFATVARELDVTAYELERVIAEDDTVVVLANIRLVCRGTGCEEPYRKVDVLRMQDGMIVEFREYYDTLGLARQRGIV